MNKRSFLKIIIALPILACIKSPEEIIKPKPKPDIILTQSDQFINAYASIMNIERKFLETDIELRDRILIAMETI